MKHKLLQVMVEREAHRVLEGRVEIDDAYLGGERPGKPGRGSENKIPFVVAVQTTDDGQPVVARMNRIAFTKDAMQAWAHTALAPSAHVISDGLHCFKAVAGEVACHTAIVVGSGRQAVTRHEFRRVNTVLHTSRQRFLAPTMRSSLPSMLTAILPRCSIASIVASISHPSSPDSSALLSSPARGPRQ